MTSLQYASQLPHQPAVVAERRLDPFEGPVVRVVPEIEVEGQVGEGVGLFRLQNRLLVLGESLVELVPVRPLLVFYRRGFPSFEKTWCSVWNDGFSDGDFARGWKIWQVWKRGSCFFIRGNFTQWWRAHSRKVDFGRFDFGFGLLGPRWLEVVNWPESEY